MAKVTITLEDLPGNAGVVVVFDPPVEELSRDTDMTSAHAYAFEMWMALKGATSNPPGGHA